MALTKEEMSARYATEEMKKAGEKLPEFIVSCDGHVDEPPDIFDDLPADIREKINRPKIMLESRPKGGVDPAVRLEDMKLDGVVAEVLYPTFVLGLFGQEQREQEAAFPVYNNWIADFCKQAPGKFGVFPVSRPTISISRSRKCSVATIWGYWAGLSGRSRTPICR